MHLYFCHLRVKNSVLYFDCHCFFEKCVWFPLNDKPKMENNMKVRRKKRNKCGKQPSDCDNNINRNSKSPSKKIGILQNSTRRKKIRKLAERVLCPFKDLPQQVFVCSESEGIVTRKIYSEQNILNETIDLCDENSNLSDSSVDVVPVSIDKKGNPDLIDLSTELLENNEIIDLTEFPKNLSKTQNENSKLSVIELSEDEGNKEETIKPVNSDDILVIGTFSKTSSPRKKSKTRLKKFKTSPLKSGTESTLLDSLKEKYLCKRLENKKSKVKRLSNRYFEFYNKKNVKTGNNLKPKIGEVGENIYVNSPVPLPSSGLRPIIIDGSNVAYVHSSCNFSCKRLEICINYFKEKGHKVTAFVPQYRLNNSRSDNPQLLRKLEKQGDVVFTPSKCVDGRNIVPYDDRFIVQTAVIKGGVIISRDNYNDLLRENPAWAETIKYRTLAFTWVDDVLMFPKDPLGEYGPTLEQFLRFH